MASPSLLVFGPQSSLLSEDWLVQLRSTLLGNRKLEGLVTAITQLESIWNDLALADPSFKGIPGQEHFRALSNWISSPGNSDPPAELSRLNLLLTPLTVIAHLVEYFNYLEVSGLSHEQLLNSTSINGGGFQGFCTGLLAAVTLSLAKDEGEAVKLSTSVLGLAVALGAYVDLDGCFANPPREFSCLSVRWKSSEESLSVFKAIEEHAEAYVSVNSDVLSATVTLPKQTQDELVAKLTDLGVTARPYPLSGRFHSSIHEEHVEKIVSLGNSNTKFRFPVACGLPNLVRDGTGSPIGNSTPLHEVIARSMLVQRSEWSSTIRSALPEPASTGTEAVVFGLVDCIPRSLVTEGGLTVTRPGFQKTGAYVYPEDAVAVVGLACRFPGADSLEEYWQLLLSKASMLGKLPTERFPTKGLRRTPKDDIPFIGNFLRDGYAFDNKFFNRSPREASAMDPQHKLILQVAYEALETAGYFSHGSSPSDVGCYVGVAASDYEDNVASHLPTAFSVLGMVRAFVSGKISHFFNLSGPSMVFDTACSSSAVAIHTACQALRNGECSMALAGGVNVITSPVLHQNLAAANFLSPTGESKAFDARADGYCRGEGAGMVVLKKYSTALADGDHIYGIIAGSAVNQNDNCAAITVPVSKSQTALYKRVLKMGRMDPEKVSYVEAHGTGTPKGDPIECASIREVFGNQPSRKLHFGSVKASIGHTEAASGVAGLIKVLLMMHHRTIPPQASFQTLNPNIPPLGPSNMEIALTPRDWNGEFLAACVNNYGAAGSNAAMLICQPPRLTTTPKARRGRDSLPMKYPVMLRAKSAASLQAYCNALTQFLDKASAHTSDDQLLADVAYGLATHQNISLPYSLGTTVDSLARLRQELSACASATLPEEQTAKAKSRPVIMVFSGQTGNTVNLSEEAYRSSLLLQSHLNRCDRILRSLGHPSIFPAIFSKQPISDTLVLHCAVFALQYSCAWAWIDAGVQIDAMIGHSFGQLTALCVAGAMSLEDGLKLIAGRAILVRDQWGPERGAMISVGAGEQQTQELVASAHQAGIEVEIACFNAKDNHVVVGSASSIAAFEDLVAGQGSEVRLKRLEVTHGFHSVFVDGIMPEYKALLDSISFSQPKIHVETCSPGSAWNTVNSELVAQQSRDAVHFSAAISRIQKKFSDCVWLEAGSGTAAIPLARRALQAEQVDIAKHAFHAVKLGAPDAMELLAQTTLDLWNSGTKAMFWPFHRSQKHQYNVLQLPPYQFEKRHHWLEYVDRHGSDAPAPVAAIEAKPADMVSFSQYADDTGNLAIFNINQETSEFQAAIEGHRVLGHPLCPVSLYIEVATRAAALLHPNFSTETHASGVDALEIFTPLGLDTARQAQVTLLSIGEDEWEFTVHSFPLGDTASRKTRHATARIRITSLLDKSTAAMFARFQRLAKYEECEALFADGAAAGIQGPLVYKMFDKVVNYSGIYRGVLKIASKNQKVSGLVQLPDATAKGADMEKSACNPLAIDNFTQVAGLHVNGLDECGNDEVYICSQVDEIRALQSLKRPDGGSAGPWLVHANFSRQGDRELLNDIFVFDTSAKTLVMTILGVRFTKTNVNMLQKVLARANTAHSHQAQAKVEPPRTAAAQIKSAISTQLIRTANAPERSRNRKRALEDKVNSNIRIGLKQLLQEVADVSPEQIHDSTLLVDVGIDSLMATEVQTAIGDRFGVLLTTAEFQSIEDFGSLCAAVQPAQSSARSSSEDDLSDDNELLASSHSATPASSVEYEFQNDELVAKLQKLVAGHLDVSEAIAPDLLLADAGVDSLLGIELGADIEKEFGRTIDMMQLSPTCTFADLVKMVIPEDSHNTNIDVARAASMSGGKPLTPSFAAKGQAPAAEKDLLAHAAEDFRAIRSDYLRFAKETGWAGFRQNAYPKQRQLVLSYVLEAFAQLGCDIARVEGGDVLPNVPHMPKHAKVVGQFYKVLQEASLVRKQGDKLVRSQTPCPKTDAEELVQQMIVAYPQHASELKLLRSTGSKLADVLPGKVDPLQIIFRTKADRDLLEDVYTNSPMFSTGTKVLANFFTKALEIHRGGEQVRILELGAGTGGTTKTILETLSSMGVNFSYTFTDLSSSLVAAAKRKFAKYGDAVNFSVLDVEKPPPQHLVGNYHIALASNCVHATKSLLVSSTNTCKMLRQDGMLCLLELTRNLYWLDCVFGLLEGWWLFEDGREHVLADEFLWKDTLLRAGFKHVDWSDDDSEESDQFRLVVGFKSAPDHLISAVEKLQLAAAAAKKAAAKLVTKETVEYHRVGDVSLQADIYYPDQPDDGTAKRPIALMIHGGGHIMLSRKDIRPRQTRLLLSRGLLPISIDYRLCPEVTLPAGPMTDVGTALHWARTTLPSLLPNATRPDIRADGSRVVVIGWSTGGTLSMTLPFTAPARGIAPPEAVLAFYCPTDYQDGFWREPNFPEETTEREAGVEYDLLEGVRDGAITAYNVPAAQRATGGWMSLEDPRSRIALHMNWKGQALPVLLGGLPSKGKAGEGVDWKNRPQPSDEEVAAVSPYAQVVAGSYRTPTFLIHGTRDDLIPWQHTERIKDALVERGVPAGAAIVQDAVHLFDLYGSEGWEAVLEGYEFLFKQIGV
nr:polyketide synthase 19 [Chaetomium globosum]